MALASHGLRNSQDTFQHTIINIGAKMGAYVWLTTDDLMLSTPGRGLITFEAKASNDIHISLNKSLQSLSHSQDGLSGQFYELCIGGWMNTKTAIRKSGQQKSYITKRTNPNAATIHPIGEFCKYWLSVHNGLLILGKGDVPGQNECLRWRDDDSDDKSVKYVGFSSWDTPIQFRNVKISAEWIDDGDEKKTQGEPCLWLVNDPILSDVTIKLNDTQKVFAHRAILAVAGDWLMETMVTTNVLDLAGIQLMHCTEFLKYLYGCKVNLTNDILDICQKLKITVNLEEVQDRRKLNFEKLYKDPIFSDVTLIVEGNKIKAHRVIFSLASEHFYAMFNSRGFKESLQNEVELHDMSYSSFLFLLEFIYTGKVEKLTVDGAILLVELANRFWMISLKELCIQYLKENLDVFNCVDILYTANNYDATNLYNFCLHFIENNFEQVGNEVFEEIDPSLLLEIVLSDNLVVTKEERVYEKVLLWAKADLQERGGYLSKLLQCLRYSLMDKEYLEKLMESEDFKTYGPLDKGKEALNFLNGEKKQSSLESDVKIVKNFFVVSNDPVDILTKPRKSNKFTELLFSHCGDECGVFYWIGSEHRTKRWTNPHRSGLVTVKSSSGSSRYTKPDVLVNRTFQTRNYTAGKPNPWWAVDLAEGHSLLCNYYSLTHDGSTSFLRSWVLQGSNDEKEWVALSVHDNDCSIHFSGQNVAWPVTGKNAAISFRYFRILMTGAAADSNYFLSLCGLELYGHYM